MYVFSMWAEYARASALTPPGATFVTAGSEAEASETAVKLRFLGSSSRVLRAPVSGVVSWTADVRPGAVIQDGQPLARIGPRLVVANVGRVPFYRELGPGAKGDDVARLNDLLQASGLSSDRDTPATFTARTASGVRALNARVGARDRAVFSPESTVFVAPDSTFHAWTTKLGDLIEPGAELGVAWSAPTDVRIEHAQEGADLSRQLPAHVRAPDGHTVAISVDEPTAPRLLQLVLEHGGQVSTARDPNPTTESASSASDVTVTGAMWAPLERRSVALIPASALYTRADGRMCVFGKGVESTSDVQPIPVTKAESWRVGTVRADATLVGKAVVADTARLTSDALKQC